MTPPRRPMLLTTLLNAPHNTWRYTDGHAYGEMDLGWMIEAAKIAERGKLHALFLADLSGIKDDRVGLHAVRKSGSATGFEPLTLLSALAMVTQDIGLIATLSTTYSEPYTVARMLGSLDHLSRGRAGWNLVTSGTKAEAANYGLAQTLTSAHRYARANEHLDITRRLWDSFDDGAFPRDPDSGLFFDPDQAHYLDHHGDHFQVRGPLNMPRPPQGHPVISQAGTSEAGYDMAARGADVMYVKAPTLEIGQAFYRDMTARCHRIGRDPNTLALMPGLSVIVGDSEAEARARFAEITASLEAEEGVAYLAQWLDGYDLTGLPLDAPVPDIPEINIPAERNRIFLTHGDRRFTIREAMQHVATSVGHLTLFGTPKDVAQQMAHWIEAKGADGFSLMPYYMPGGLAEFVDHVVPELQAMGAFQTEYTGATLRERMGLPRPQSLFAEAPRTALHA